MRLWQRFAVRILVIALFAGVVVALVLRPLFWRAYSSTSEDALFRFSERLLHGDGARCEAAPETWSAAFLGADAVLYAYDPASGTSRNPNAPPLAPGWAEGGRSRLEYTKEGGYFWARVAASGPCGLVQARWKKVDDYRRRFLFSELATYVAVTAFVAGASMALVIWPLLRRVKELEQAARAMGEPTFRQGEVHTDDELGSLSRSLARAHERIESQMTELAAHRTRLEEFLSEAAHDLRTPLGSLRLALEHLARDSGGSGAGAERREVIDGALKDVVYLSALADNLRLSHKLKSGWHPADTDEPIDLGDIVDRAAARARVFARHRGITVEHGRPESSVPVRCNLAAAEQVVANLLDNAVLYGRAGGHVSVVVESRRDAFTLYVRDDGPGVVPEAMESLTVRNFRERSAQSRNPSGAGLGLAIVQEVCTHCDWRLVFAPMSPAGLEVRIEGKLERR
jgi:signal transduction histidine kinase